MQALHRSRPLDGRNDGSGHEVAGNSRDSSHDISEPLRYVVGFIAMNGGEIVPKLCLVSGMELNGATPEWRMACIQHSEINPDHYTVRTTFLG